ncbi:MAG: glucose-6-phosphate isomerase [Candidatus Marinamargulisbacteria bacterium]|jgi:glucose-6-phosphate isomerase
MTPTKTLTFKNLDALPIYKELAAKSAHTVDLSKALTQERLHAYLIDYAPFKFVYSTALVEDEVLNLLQTLANDQQVIDKYENMLEGFIINQSENEKTLHHLTRNLTPDSFYKEEQKKIGAFAADVHSGTFKSANGKAFDTVVSIGIGGSHLGPSAMYEALRYQFNQQAKQKHLKCHFISNIDPDRAEYVLNQINLDSTLFIFASKSGTTLETTSNLEILKAFAESEGFSTEQLHRQLIFVTSTSSELPVPEQSPRFFIDDAISGRFSATSAVGAVVTSLCFGPTIFEEILAGAHHMDRHAKNPDIRQNIPLLFALLDVWEHTFLGYPNKLVIPYSESLGNFPKFIQQLVCESNGKSVNIRSEPITYPTAPIIISGRGTNSQHSIFQKLHQGSDIIPTHFIGVQNKKSQRTAYQKAKKKLNANLIAQMMTLALGGQDSDPNKAIVGNKPSTLLLLDNLSPFTLGSLISVYENLATFQGFLWNLNPFDQQGVQYSKEMSLNLLTQDTQSTSLSRELKNLLM